MERRQFLRGQVSRRNDTQRPPWSLAESEFVEHCSRCNACIDACHEGILLRGDGGFPQVDYRRGECTFCGDCATACQSHALRSDNLLPEQAWQAVACIQDSCLSLKGITCRTCGDTCDTRAIHFELKTGGRALVYVDSALCNACGACVAPCPINAISITAAPKAAQQQQLEDCA